MKSGVLFVDVYSSIPKRHNLLEMPVMDVSLKNTWRGGTPFSGVYVKSAVGGGDTVIVCTALVELP